MIHFPCTKTDFCVVCLATGMLALTDAYVCRSFAAIMKKKKDDLIFKLKVLTFKKWIAWMRKGGGKCQHNTCIFEGEM